MTPSNLLRGREIVDPCLGTRWRLQVDSAHLGWPPRLVQANSKDGRYAIAGRKNAVPVEQIAIRVGDRIELEQEDGLIHARFAALALEPAAVGEVLKVRLMPGSLGGSKFAGTSFRGTTASAVTIGSGHARWLSWEKVAR